MSHLVLTRKTGSKVYCGYQLEKEDLEQTSDFIIGIEEVTGGLKERKVEFSVENSKERTTNSFILSADKQEKQIGESAEVTLVLIDVVSSTKENEGRPIPKARIGIEAPKNMKVYRDDINK